MVDGHWGLLVLLPLLLDEPFIDWWHAKYPLISAFEVTSCMHEVLWKVGVSCEFDGGT